MKKIRVKCTKNCQTKQTMFEIKSNTVEPATGRVLLSEPLLQDFYFRRSAVLLIDHQSDGSFGVIINKPIHTRLSEIMPDLNGFDARVFIGGPVDAKTIFFTHSYPELISGSEKISGNLFWGGSISDAVEAIRSGLILPENIRFFLGYSGWGSGQIEMEIKRNSWAVAIPDVNELLTMPPDKVWPGLVQKLGKDYRFWTLLPTDPQLN